LEIAACLRPAQQPYGGLRAGRGHVFRIGFVDDDHDGIRQRGEERLQRGIVEPRARRIVGIGNIDEPRVGAHGRRHRGEVMAERCRCMIRGQRRHADRLGARRRRADREHGESILRIHDRGLRIRKALRDQHQQLMRAVAERDLRRLDVEVCGKCALERAALGIRIAVDVGQRRGDRRGGRAAGAERGFVGAEFDEPLAVFPAQRRQVMARVVGAQCARRRVREADDIAAHSSATG
jgi:hypothetical protein